MTVTQAKTAWPDLYYTIQSSFHGNSTCLQTFMKEIFDQRQLFVGTMLLLEMDNLPLSLQMNELVLVAS